MTILHHWWWRHQSPPHQEQSTLHGAHTKYDPNMFLRPVYIITFHLLTIHFSTILPPMLRSCRGHFLYISWIQFQRISHVCHVYYAVIPSEPHLDNAELVSRSNSIEHAHTAYHVLQLMFRHTVNLISRKNLWVDCIESYHRSWNTKTNTKIQSIQHAVLCYTSWNTCYLHRMWLPWLSNIRIYSRAITLQLRIKVY